ncbi:kinectin isoform X2 [Gadus morhua]|uniref:kinectin isoform X2 n=1 Tax=Gadus morhua TaxID=8049 RepID=UPI0011B4EC24|nr:kinectin isoform X2 [Gadus morhua]
MAVDIYDSQYLLILAPSLVIALMFLFFWLFMKETSYDEVLAKQKRDLKLPLFRADVRKKGDKKKSKKKENAGGGGGGVAGGGGESEEDQRDFDLTDAASSSSPELEDEPEQAILPAAAPVFVAAPVEAPAGLRERKKKEKKAAKAAAAAAAAATAAAAAAAATAAAAAAAAPPTPTPTPTEEPAMNGSRPASRKSEAPLSVSKRPGSASPKPDVQAPVVAQVLAQVQTPPLTSGKKKDKKKQKVEAVEDQQQEIKVEQVAAPAPVKKEVHLMSETSLPPATTGGKKKNSAKKQKAESVDEPHVLVESAAPANHQAAPNDNSAPSKGSGKKQKNETDKVENAEMKLKELIGGLSSMALTEAEVVSVMALLCDKSPHALETWHKSAAKADPEAQERERLFITLREEASIAKDKVKQLSQELQVEKQKTGRAESMLREQHAVMQKELGGMQAKTQSGYQELQAMQINMREQLEGQISRLKQENSILRDAVSSAANQMESKNSAELNKLRSEYSGLMKELTETNGKLQQEEHQRKGLEVGYKQNVSQLEAQLQDTKRHWEELQNYHYKVNAEREKLQAAKQELQNQLLSVETEMNSKNNEIQNLHGSLQEAIVSKDRVEQRVRQLLEVTQHSMPDETLQAQVQELLNENKGLQVQIESQQHQNENLQAQMSSQATHISHFEELQKLLAEKELQRKSLEDSLSAERSSGAVRETNMQAIHNESRALMAELLKLKTQISEQNDSRLALDQIQMSVQEREENIKTVEDLLKTGLIEVANKEEELQAVREENQALKRDVEAQKRDVEALRQQASEQITSETTVEELKSQLQQKDGELLSMDERLQASLGCSSATEQTIAVLEREIECLQVETVQLRQRGEQSSADASAQVLDLQAKLCSKDEELHALQGELEARTREVSQQVEQLQQQSQSVTPSPELLAALSEKDRQVSDLQVELSELRDSVELHRKKNNELREKNWSVMEALSATEALLQGKLSKAVKESQTALDSTQAECRDALHRLLPHVALPSGQNHEEWLNRFEQAAAESSAAQSNCAPASGELEGLQEKLKETEEAQKVMQKDCETYKKVLAETEGILQRLQSSVESEESRWKLKLEVSQGELGEMNVKVAALEQEIERLSDGAELENLRREKQQLEAELDRAERESATYVTEVKELKDLLTELQSKLDGSYTEAVRQNEQLIVLKTQLTRTVSKLQTEESERQKVAGDLYKAQQSLDLIQEELSKETGNADLIENSMSQTEEIDRKVKMTPGLTQTVRELQLLIQNVNQQLTKGQDAEADKDLPEV